MAILHQATLSPTKLELIADWLPGQPWFRGSAESIQLIGAYRFDDPDGAVGVETHLVGVDGPVLTVLQVPVTYRDAPLAEAQDALIGTMEHSVLGPRWVYDGLGDPVYRRTLAATIETAGSQAALDIQTPDGLVRRDPTTRVQGSGGAVPDADAVEVIRVVDPAQPAPSSAHLTGTWPGQDAPVLLAYVR